MNQRGGFILPFLALLLISLPLFFFLVDFAQARLIGMRLDRAALSPDACDVVLPKGELGITATEQTDDFLTVSYTPYFPFKTDQETMTRALSKPKLPSHLIVALDVFLPENQGSLADHYSVLFKALGTWVEQGNKLTLIPYAASINLNVDYPVTFPSKPPKNKQPPEFKNLSPVRALKMNAKQKYKLGQTPQRDLWSGCISLKKRCDFNAAEPFFYPSSFGQSSTRFKGQYHENLLITGPNNWTEKTITEKNADQGSFIQGPNLGCPDPVLSTQDKDELHHYLGSLRTIRRGGSHLPLAIDYGLHLLKNDTTPRALLITKLSDDICYLWNGPSSGAATEATGYPRGETIDVLGCAEPPIDMLAATQQDLNNFKRQGGKVIGLFKTDNTEFSDLVEESHRLKLDGADELLGLLNQ